jgi:hypothetical protein
MNHYRTKGSNHMGILSKLFTPSYDRLVNQANRELHKFHLGKYKNYQGALVHKNRAGELFRQAAAMKKN